MTRGATPAATAGEVRQPLSGMILNATAGLHWLERSTPDIDEAKAAFRQIVADSLRAAAVIESITGELQEGLSPHGLLVGRFRRAATTIAGIELMHRIRKGQFKLGKLRVKNKTAPEIWNAVLARDPRQAPERFLALISFAPQPATKGK